jgi:spore coat polysaccharide biosynthesis predicted glycosyltransferase SpsG
MNILVRAYGSHLMGMGHLYRVKKIVNGFKAMDNTITFTLLTRKYDEAIDVYTQIPVNERIEINKDAQETEELVLISGMIERFDFVLNDQLNTSKNMGVLLSQAHKSITFDDLGEGNQYFDHIINVLYPTQKQLKNEFNSYGFLILDDNSRIKNSLIFKEEIQTIFVNQGAADTWGAIPEMIKDLNKIDINFKIKVLLGPSFRDHNKLADVLKCNTKQIEIYNFVDNVSEIVQECDLAILGAGNTLFEVASLGIPIIASTREEKELITIDRLSKDNIVYTINTIYESGLEAIVRKVIDDEEGRREKFVRNRKLFDSHGLYRIYELAKGKS